MYAALAEVHVFRALFSSLLFACSLVLCTSIAARDGQAPATVVFLNPGFSQEPFWTGYSDFMQAAASDLGINLQVIYGERDPQRILDNAHDVLKSPELPDYLIFTNEMYLGPELLRLFAHTPVKLFALHSTLTPEQRQIAGESREHYGNWIGSLVPNDEEGGYLMAKALFASIGDKPAELLAFSGVRHTPSATLRETGLHRALSEHPQIRLQQLVYGEWKRQRAYEQAQQLLQRYPQVSLIWSANDEMAFGAMQAAVELKKTPGKDLYFSALNNSAEVFQARIRGDISALVGGHFTLGGWALVMLHDYHGGYDFAQRGGKDRVAPLFKLLDAQQARALQSRIERKGYGVDFRRFSAVYQPQLKDYAFSIKAMLR
jgi:ABC-type sugar transport system substrate-binding protein